MSNRHEKSPLGEGEKGTHPAGEKSTSPQVQLSTHFKQSISNDSLNNISNNSPEPDMSSLTVIHEYFRGIALEKKRQSEWENYLCLKQTHSAQQIAAGLQYLLNHGIPKSGAGCHSPMAYLAVAISAVLGAQETQPNERKQPAVQFKKNEAEQEEDDWDDLDFQEKYLAFQKAFPRAEDQQNYFRDFSSRYPALKLCGPGMQNIAIRVWVSEQFVQLSA
jgi:hypothetical protein